MTITYLINQYPQLSQAFIRCEIAALENLGLKIGRYTLRCWDQPLRDDADKAEQHRTHVVLGVGGMGLLLVTLRTLFTRPTAWWQGGRLAWKFGRRSERGLLVQ
jgi:hypothetical protein